MGGILTLINQHQIISFLGIVLALVAAWGAGYLKGHRHGEDREAEYQQSRREALIKHHNHLLEKVMAENHAWQKRCRRLENHLTQEAGLRNVLPLAIAPGPKEPPTPPNHKEVG